MMLITTELNDINIYYFTQTLAGHLLGENKHCCSVNLRNMSMSMQLCYY